MNGLLDDLVGPFERISPETLATTLRDDYALDIRALTRLDTERDDTFRVDHTGGVVLVKVAHPSDSPELLALQDAALAAVAEHDPELPVPRLVPTTSGGASALLDGRIVRVLTWLPGVRATDRPWRPQVGGAVLGRLSLALAHLTHPAADRILPWDLRRVPGLAPYTDEPLLVDAFARYAAEISPVLDALPRQVVHNDFHPGNVFVGESGAISGIVDFGDVVLTPRVCDLGVSLGYLIPDDSPGDAVRAEFTAGYESVVPLTDEERSLIPGLVVGRELQRIVINEELGRRDGGSHAAPRVRRLLHRALEDWA
ncbi:MAG: phosphotransferase [Pseudolysinimonas sp.]|uniref:phosphotransferase n=1 Tax=Pseudolysinimonas sp. TaxID=2680009 RepID=UPI0032647408